MRSVQPNPRRRSPLVAAATRAIGTLSIAAPLALASGAVVTLTGCGAEPAPAPEAAAPTTPPVVELGAPVDSSDQPSEPESNDN